MQKYLLRVHMLPFAEYIDTLKYSQIAAWIVSVLTFLLFFGYLRKAIAYVMLKMYEFFIGSSTHITPD